ncbi:MULTISPECIES: hypothetical protein [unclassified Streptomyces]|uniref:Uncharacterized protein n=1 Tax=Streptomyces sp. NBC_00119 TaxID=2975659 RepID=A0AAU1UKD0_9ACTN|nr:MULTISPECIES: hypothetical protein [unclassified Streptomyces]MCX4649979.1 hypothetical protein [Streptomyces sp. NBC_01446]MCX5320803.1 hypothetical protein [Streptomyces sp. NBC_00120]
MKRASMRSAGATAAARIADDRAVETGHRVLGTLLAEGEAGSPFPGSPYPRKWIPKW